MEWIQHLTIKSVGRETAAFHGKQVPCRWVEIKVVTGKASEAGIEPGPVGERVYKILVPEERVVGQVSDGEKIPFSYLDIVKGFRKIGGGTATPIPLVRGSEGAGAGAGAFQVFPLVAPLMHYDALEPAGREPESVQTPGGAVPARKFKASRVVESPTVRTTDDAEIWRSSPPTDQVPFGLVKWATKTKIERKDTAAPRSAFKLATQMTVEMSAHEWGNGAKSEIAAN